MKVSIQQSALSIQSFAHCVAGQHGHVIRTRVMTRGVHPARIDEVRIFEAQGRSFLVHPLDVLLA